MGHVPACHNDEANIAWLGVDDEGRCAALDAHIWDIMQGAVRKGAALCVLLMDHWLHIYEPREVITRFHGLDL